MVLRRSSGRRGCEGPNTSLFGMKQREDKRMVFRAWLALIALLLVANTAGAGVVLTWQTTSNGERVTTSMYFDRGKVRVEAYLPDSPTRIAIFDGDTETLWVMRQEQGTYRETTMAKARQLWRQMLEFARRAEQLAASPGNTSSAEPQRGEHNVAELGSVGPTPTFRQSGGTSRFGTWLCSNYEVTAGGKHQAEICATSFESMQLTARDGDSFSALGELALYLEGNPAIAIVRPHSPGIPIHVTSGTGTLALESTLLKVEQRPLDPSLFHPPSDMRKVEDGPNNGGRERR
jgi:hypothetical protein